MFTKRHLDNGIPVVMEQLKNFRSVILGIWVKVGSRNETRDKNGISHFLEHMFFKGTKKRTATDISIDIDSLGGDLNAFTSRENTAFYVKVLDEYIDKGIELLSDIFLHSTFPQEEIEKEKGVIKEEIKLVEDTPDDYIHDLFSRTVWGDAGLGQPVLGRRETIKTFTHEDLISHVRKYYGTSDTVVACAGNFEPDHVMNLLSHHLGGLRRGSEPELFSPPSFKSEIAVYPKDLSEVHICFGVEGLPYASEDRYAIAILNSIVGSSVSSRLFQEIREKMGYAYSIYSFVSSYLDTGFWAVYAGTGRKKALTVTELIIKEMKGLYETISDVELKRAKDQLKGNLVLGLESTSSRMQSIARQEIYYGRYFSQKEIMKEVEAVTLDQARSLARRLINDGKMSLTVLGPVKGEDFKGLF
ncbi:MAG: pitrilysin family protein [Thermodesulfovibrionales bacterium]|jgi:predicted Zn-dependent peptidase|nr:pitrilysin family protein [Thermodesulfovibrionales bacterium]